MENIVNIGDVIQLNDRVENRYKETKYYAKGLDCEYDISKYDDFDFHHVFINVQSFESVNKNPLVKAHKVFSFLQEKVTGVKCLDGVDFIITKHLIIDIEKAMKNDEVILKNDSICTIVKEDIKLLEIHQDIIENHYLGLLSRNEMMCFLIDQNEFYFGIFQNKWPRNYSFRFQGGIS